MVKCLKQAAIEAFIALVCYFALVDGNEYAINLLMPVIWCFSLLSIIGAFLITNNEEFRVKLSKDLKVKSGAGKIYSFVFDASIALSLIAFGYVFTGIAWAIGCLLASTARGKIDEQIKTGLTS